MSAPFSASAAAVVGQKRSRSEVERQEQEAAVVVNVPRLRTFPVPARLRDLLASSNEARFLAHLVAALRDEVKMTVFINEFVVFPPTYLDEDEREIYGGEIDVAEAEAQDQLDAIKGQIASEISKACASIAKSCRLGPEASKEDLLASTAKHLSLSLHLLIPLLSDASETVLSAILSTSLFKGPAAVLQFSGGLFSLPTIAGSDSTTSGNSSDLRSKLASVAKLAEATWSLPLGWALILSDMVSLADMAEASQKAYSSEHKRLSAHTASLAKTWDAMTLQIQQCDAVLEQAVMQGLLKHKSTDDITAADVTSGVLNLVSSPNGAPPVQRAIAERKKALDIRQEVENKGLVAKAEAAIADSLGRLNRFVMDAVEAVALTCMRRLQARVVHRTIELDRAVCEVLALWLQKYSSKKEQLRKCQALAEETRKRLEDFSHQGAQDTAPTTAATLQDALGTANDNAQRLRDELAELLQLLSALAENLSLLPLECRGCFCSRLQALLSASSASSAALPIISPAEPSSSSSSSSSTAPTAVAAAGVEGYLKRAFGERLLAAKLKEAFDNAVVNGLLMEGRLPASSSSSFGGGAAPPPPVVPEPLQQVERVLKRSFPQHYSPSTSTSTSSTTTTSSGSSSNTNTNSLLVDIAPLLPLLPLDEPVVEALRAALRTIAKGYTLPLPPPWLKAASATSSSSSSSSSSDSSSPAAAAVSLAVKSALAAKFADGVSAEGQAATATADAESALRALLPLIQRDCCMPSLRILGAASIQIGGDENEDADEADGKGDGGGPAVRQPDAFKALEAAFKAILAKKPAGGKVAKAAAVVRELLTLQPQSNTSTGSSSSASSSVSSLASADASDALVVAANPVSPAPSAPPASSSSSSSSSSSVFSQTSKTCRSLFDAHALLGSFPQADFSLYQKLLKERDMELAALAAAAKAEAEKRRQLQSQSAGPAPKRARVEREDEDEDEDEEEDEEEDEDDEVQILSGDEDDDEADDSVDSQGEREDETNNEEHGTEGNDKAGKKGLWGALKSWLGF